MGVPENLVTTAEIEREKRERIDLTDREIVERIASCGGAQRIRQPHTEPIPEASTDRRQGVSICNCGPYESCNVCRKYENRSDATDRRQGVSIHIGLLGSILSALDESGKGLSLERQIATLECALRIVRADNEEPIFPTSESHRGGCQGHA